MEQNKTELTQKELEAISLCLFCFKSAYYLQTHKKLTTVDQIIDVINEGTFTFEDVFSSYLDSCFKELDEDESLYWEKNMERFDLETYFPKKSKLPEGGSWVKIRTAVGFEVHFAKETSRKRRFNEEYSLVLKQAAYQAKRLADLLEKFNTESPSVKKASAKLDSLMEKKNELAVRIAIDLPIYEVKIQRTKSKLEFLLPCQYEIIDDINQFAEAYINEVAGVNVKRLYSSDNKDAIFYMTSRGISKKNAEMMAALKQTYFTVDLYEALSVYNEQFRQSVKIVEVKESGN